VVTDLAQFEYYNGQEYGHYDPASDTLYVGRLAPTSAGGPWTAWNRNTGQQEVIGAAGEGIDCCAITCIHELNHQWAAKVDTGWDSDNDGLSDTFELATAGGWNLDPNYPDTYDIAGLGLGPWALGDQEFVARKAEQNPGNVDASKDWSDTNDKNWGEEGGPPPGP